MCKLERCPYEEGGIMQCECCPYDDDWDDCDDYDDFDLYDFDII